MNDAPPTTPDLANDVPGASVIVSSVLLGSKNPTLQGFEPTALEAVREMPIQGRVDRAIALLKAHEPTEGYAVAFSGGKDSCAIKKLCQMAGVPVVSVLTMAQVQSAVMPLLSGPNAAQVNGLITLLTNLEGKLCRLDGSDALDRL